MGPYAQYILNRPSTGRFGAFREGLETDVALGQLKKMAVANYLAEAQERREKLLGDLYKMYEQHRLDLQKQILQGQLDSLLGTKDVSKIYSRIVKVYNNLERDREKGRIWGQDRWYRELLAQGVDISQLEAQKDINPKVSELLSTINYVAERLPEDEKVWNMTLMDMGQAKKIDYSTAKALAEEALPYMQVPKVVRRYKRAWGLGGETEKEVAPSPGDTLMIDDTTRQILSRFAQFIAGKKVMSPEGKEFTPEQYEQLRQAGVIFTAPPKVVIGPKEEVRRYEIPALKLEPEVGLTAPKTAVPASTATSAPTTPRTAEEYIRLLEGR